MKKGLIGFLAACTLFQFAVVGHSQNVKAEELVVYSTGFESTEGFVAGTNYQSTVTSGNSEQQWTTYYGTPSTTSPISGSQSMQMRLYTSPGDIPYTRTNFAMENATKLTFKAKNTSNINVKVSKSVDLITWTDEITYTLSTSAKDFTYTISDTGETVYLKFTVVPPSSPVNKSRLYIDDVTVYGLEDTSSEPEEQVKADKNEINNLIDRYKGSDSKYIKDTIINLKQDEVVKEEVIKYFHAESTVLERTTYYNDDELWMTNGKGGYSYYGTNENGDLTNATVESVGVTSDKVCIKGISMEEKYITLNDIINTNTDSWYVKNGVYSSSHEDDIANFLAFTAPCFLDLAEHSNYIGFEKVEIEENNDKLELRLIVESGNVGLLNSGSNYIFSKATIVNGWKQTYVHTFAKDDLGTDGSDTSSGLESTLSDLVWNSSTNATYKGFDNTKGVQIGSSKNPASYINLTTNGLGSSKIYSIIINTSGGSNVVGSFEVSVGGVKCGETVTLTSSATDYTFECSNSGEILIKWTVSEKAVYIKSITIVWEA